MPKSDVTKRLGTKNLKGHKADCEIKPIYSSPSYHLEFAEITRSITLSNLSKKNSMESSVS
jgi:hypothetical protein